MLRVCLQEGLPFLLPHLTKQVLRLPVADFMRLLADRNVPLLIPSSANGNEQETAAAAAAAKTPSNQVGLEIVGARRAV
jgi:flagellar motor protein MotB